MCCMRKPRPPWGGTAASASAGSPSPRGGTGHPEGVRPDTGALRGEAALPRARRRRTAPPRARAHARRRGRARRTRRGTSRARARRPRPSPRQPRAVAPLPPFPPVLCCQTRPSLLACWACCGVFGAFPTALGAWRDRVPLCPELDRARAPSWFRQKRGLLANKCGGPCRRRRRCRRRRVGRWRRHAGEGRRSARVHRRRRHRIPLPRRRPRLPRRPRARVQPLVPSTRRAWLASW